MIVVSCPDCGKHLLWHLAHEHRCDKQPQKSKPAKPPMVRCAMCDESYPLHLAREHKCAQKSKPARKPTTAPVEKTIASNKNSPSSRRIDTPPVATPPEPVATADVATPVATETARVQKWREKNREAYNARMRAYRARQKAPE